jgi:hypothetical protein
VAAVALLYRHGLHADFGFGERQLTFPMVRARLDEPSPAIEAAKRDAKSEPFRLIGTDATLIPGFNAVYRVEGINGPDAIMNPYYRALGRAAGVLPEDDWLSLVRTPEVAKFRPVLDFLNVRYLISAAAVDRASGYTRIATDDFDVYRSATTWPRAFFTSDIRTYNGVSELIERIHDARSPFAAVQSSDRSAIVATEPIRATPHRTVPATSYRLTTNTTAFEIDAPRAGLIVLHEAWLADDFDVTLNGEPTPYLRVNHAFKGVVVPAAGHYHVAFRYWPHRFAASLWVALAGTVGLLMTMLAARNVPVSANFSATEPT